DVDYLSTVSGGGYIGSALTWALHQDPDAGLEPHNFPFRRKEKTIAGDSTLQDYIRQHRNYLAPTSSLDITFFLAIFYLIHHGLLLLDKTSGLVTTIEANVLLILLGFLILKRFLNPNH